MEHSFMILAIWYGVVIILHLIGTITKSIPLLIVVIAGYLIMGIWSVLFMLGFLSKFDQIYNKVVG